MIKNLKEEIIKYVLESTNAENENLFIFIAGMQAQKRINKETVELEPAFNEERITAVN